MRNNLLNQLRLKQILASAVSLLRQHGIEPVLLKGFGLAMLYPNPNLRQFGDIDLFVGLDNFASIFASGEIWQYLGNTIIMWLIGLRSPVKLILISLLVPLGMWLVFYKMLKVNIHTTR